MEKELTYLQSLFGKNFIGPEQLNRISKEMGIKPITGNVPGVPFNPDTLSDKAEDHILILGNPELINGSKITINSMREKFGIDPSVSEPSFYNQDWYVNEQFATTCTLENKWYLLRKHVVEETRGLMPCNSTGALRPRESKLPSALLIAYIFFACYFHSGEILWEYDYVWCRDKDHNGDQIYAGRYKDPKKVNKNGFSVHRFLTITRNYGSVFDLS